MIKSSYEQKTCVYCNKDFPAPKRDVVRGNGRYSIKECVAKYTASTKTKKETNCECRMCGKHFYRNRTQRNNSKSGVYFCSRKCKDNGQRIENGIEEIQPDHYGKQLSAASYRSLAFRNKEMMCERCGYNKYPSVLIVHHKDRNRENNSLSNLEVLCPTCHGEEHFLAKDGPWHSPS